MVRPILPTLKDKKRYITYEVVKGKINMKQELSKNLGILGYSKAGIMFVKTNIIRCNANSLKDVKAGMCLSNAVITINKVSGSLKG